MARRRIIFENGYYNTQWFCGVGSLGWWVTNGQDTPFGFNPTKYMTVEEAEAAILGTGDPARKVIKEYT